ncbi:hypothetical protein KSS87_020891 [Heliosperma pusillum]|nr:hypothetical protein KSS87_020891 [Heliosperma pusillum]
MSTTTFTTLYSTHPLLSLNPTNHHLHHHHYTTITFSPLTLTPNLNPFPTLHLTKPKLKPYLLKPKAALLPLPQITPSLPTKDTLLTLIAVSKRVVIQLLASIHEFKEPLIAVSNAVGKWVDLYHSVLIVRILLSWFPNMPWEKQPFSAIRDLCDPCLNFFRTIMPPSANSKKIDLSPLLAFAVLGVLGSFLKTNVPPPV